MMGAYFTGVKTIKLIDDLDNKHKLLIVLDSNVLGHIINPEAKKHVDSFLKKSNEIAQEAVGSEFVTRTTLISIYECFQGENIKEYLDLFKQYSCYEIDDDVNYVAARLKSFYKKTGKEQNKIPDLFLAAISVITGCGILTCDQGDFPAPLFKEIDSAEIYWKNKQGRTVSQRMYILVTDSEVRKEFMKNYNIIDIDSAK